MKPDSSILFAVLRTLSAIVLIFAVDLYFFQALKTITKKWSAKAKSRLYTLYWSHTAYAFLIFLINMIYPFQQWGYWSRIYGFSLVIIPLFCKLPALILLIVDDSIRTAKWIRQRIGESRSPHTQNSENPKPISRLRFLSLTGTTLAALPFSAMIYGMLKTGFDLKIRKVVLRFPNLPEGFDGFRFVQISDIHSGSFVHADYFKEAFQQVKSLNPDAIFFTGDLVNNTAEEAERFETTWSELKAPMGVFSTLGNHDYGDYVVWPNEEEKAKNFESLLKVHEKAGWKLLRNEHHILKRNGDEIALLGVENWGASMRFPKKGDVNKAADGLKPLPFKILLSHDPSHWDALILPHHSDIDLTLSGHTHGMQFGIEIPGFKWSPSKYFYKQWGGTYHIKNQILYVNRGLGFLGYPGRVGIRPELTEITLKKGDFYINEMS